MSKQSALTEQECARLDEILFYNLTHNLFKMGKNPVQIYSFIEVMCSLASCNITIINSVVATILTEDRRFAPGRKEHIYLLSKAAVPVRKIVADFGMSNNTYYAIVDELSKSTLPILPKFDSKQDEEMTKFIDALDLVTTLTRRTT